MHLHRCMNSRTFARIGLVAASLSVAGAVGCSLSKGDEQAPKLVREAVASAGGCRATPGRVPTGELALVLALVLGIAVSRRRSV